ncbi:MAG: type II toxin-antitoxin system VapC family toxin [Actinobacteria bacterium]|nr:type II toxin-antitoxin system VapC family toxin [Actinomycetota bacterium]MCB9390671.1 type II toxin-antitoxin system VapC family toxin [Acidimicrobiia bacterium]
MAVDTSSLVCIVFGEPDAQRHAQVLAASPALVSAASVVEATMVVEARQGPDAARDLELILEEEVDLIVPVDAEHASVAISAWKRFGKGRHPAALNFGDCLAYASASIADVPLLFKGNDFSQTDIKGAL